MSADLPTIGMRDAFFKALYPVFEADDKAMLITADNGAPALDQFAEERPEQFINVGIAEQQLIGMACGLALEGRHVYTYAIAPFVTLRCFEQNKLDICAMNLPVVNLGVGAGYAYDIMGATHHTVEDISIMRVLPNMTIYSPADGVTAAALARVTYETRSPQYVRFDRAGIPDLYRDRDLDPEAGLITTRPGADLCLLATGIMVHQALGVAARLADRGVDAAVVDVFRLKPLNRAALLALLRPAARVVTMEEHLLAGGFGSAVAELCVDAGVHVPMLRIGQQDCFVFDNGGREAIWDRYGLDVDSITDRISAWLDAAGGSGPQA